uniref:Peptidase S1 domain-containing protein n=1 Tax=Neogobius melanostomus TaxID=47308 RepID=A0A8C6T3H4_9GOBI
QRNGPYLPLKVPDGMLQYMASVQTASGEPFCGGFLISDWFVITAAHCQLGNPQSVVLGTHDLNNADDTMRYGIRKCKGHPTFDLSSDIMLLKLSRPCPLQPVLLPKPGMKVSANDQCSVVGWGSTQTKGSGSRHLRMANVSVIDHKICSNEWGKFDVKLPEEVICAGGYGTNKGFCQGDSGGPLVCNGTAVGIVSFNYLSICDYPTYPNVYTGLNKFLPWITNALAKNDC